MALATITVTGTYKDAQGNLLKGKVLSFTPLTVFGEGGIIIPKSVVKATTNATTAAFSTTLLTSDVAGAYVRYLVTFHTGDKKKFDLTDDAATISLEDLINTYDGAQPASASVTLLDHEARIDTLESGGGGSETLTTFGALVNSATAKATPVDADQIPLMDSAASNITKKLSWANLKAALNSLYQPLASVLTNTTASFTTAQETKLSGIATGATANSSDATLLARANHTGTQAISTVTGLQAAIDAKADALGADDNYVTDAEKVKLSNLSGTNTGDQNLTPYFHKTNDDTDDITEGTNKFATAAEKTKLGHISVTQAVDLDTMESDIALKANDADVVHDTGNETVAGIKTFSSSPLVPAPTTDLQAATKKYVDDSILAGGGYTDEQAQDAVGGILTDSAEIDFTYNDAGPTIAASLIAASIDESKLDTSVNASLDLADSALQSGAIGSTVQAYSANLDEYAAVNPTAAGLALLDDADASAQRTTLGLNTTANQTDSADKRFMSDAQEAKLDAISGTNTGDQTSIVGISGTLAQFNTAISDGNIPVVDDTAYDATSWNGNTDAPTKNAIRDKIETLGGGGSFSLSSGTAGQFIRVVDANTGEGVDSVGATVEKSALVNADRIITLDSEDSLNPKYTTWTSIKAFLKTYYDTLYAAAGTIVGLSGTKAQFDTACSDGNFLYVGDVTSNATHTGDVTGATALTIANDAVTYAKMQNVSAASKLLGRGSAGGSGDVEEITLGTNLSMSGTTLNASGGGSAAFYKNLLDSGNVFPDASGNVFWEPASIKRTNDFFTEGVWIFNSPAADEHLYGSFELPAGSAGSSAVTIIWSSTVTSGTVQWKFDYRVITGDDTNSLDQASGVESVTNSDTAPGAANRRMTTAMTVTDSNFATAGTVQWRLTRVDTSDTLAGAIMVSAVNFSCNL